MSTAERNKSIIRQMYAELFTQGKLSVADALVAADFIDQEASPGQPNRGPEALRQLVTMFHTAFPDVAFHLEEVIAEGETVAARVYWTGTHRGTFLGIGPTGRTVRQKQMHFMRLRDGQLVEHLAVRDDLGLRQQLGVLAAPTEKTSPHSQSTPKAIFESMIAAANRHDLEAMVACFAPDYQGELPFTPERNFTGQAGVRINWGVFFSTMPDFQVEILRESVEGDTVWAELVFYGTQPDGEKRMMRGVNIMSIQAGKISRGKLYQNAVQEPD